MKADLLNKIVEAFEELDQSAIKIDRQDSRVTNYSLRLAKEALTALLDDIVKANTAFPSFTELVEAKGDYRPSIPVKKDWGYILANAYDNAQIKRGDSRRAYRS